MVLETTRWRLWHLFENLWDSRAEPIWNIGPARVGFGKTVLVLAAGYNILIGVVKLGLAPAAPHEANQKLAFDASVANSNSAWFYLAVSSRVLFLNLLVFRLIYWIFKRRFRSRAGEIGDAPERRSRTGEWSRAVPTHSLLIDEIDKAEISLAD